MHHLVAIEVDRPREVGVRLIVVDLLLQQQRVGAQDDEFLLGQIALHDLRHIAVQQRLAPGDRHRWRAAIIDRLHALFDRQAAVENRVGIVDLAAAGAGQIAAQQRLEHQHQRIASALELVGDGVAGNAKRGAERQGHGFLPNGACDPGMRIAHAPFSANGSQKGTPRAFIAPQAAAR